MKEHLAIAYVTDDIGMFRRFINKGFNIDTYRESNGNTALHIACSKGATKIALFCMENNVCCLTANEDGFTPLMLASIWGDLKVVKYLVEVKKVSPFATNRKTAINSLLYASLNRDPKVLEYLKGIKDE